MLRFDARLAERNLDVSFEIETGETVAFLGQNGAGKSTVLGLISGLLRADDGSATLDDRVLFDSERFTPPHARGVSLLAQDSLLFPHLTVLENVAFGPRSGGATPASARQTARDWLTEVDALEFAKRKPAQLSGGQAQRIAVARALAAHPGLLLLDEPMAALDVSVAPALRRMLRRVLENRTAIIVTHDVLDAFTLADRVFVFEDGGIVEQGSTAEIFERPRSRFAAELAGLNLLSGIRTADGLATADGTELRGRATADIAIGAPVCATVRPAAVTVSLDGGVSAANILRLEIDELAPRGEVVRVNTRMISADISPRTVADLDLDLAIGATISLGFAIDDLEIYPR
jgi:molybdate transport system ATP-binding protein